MPTYKKTLHRGDAEALLTLFENVTGTDPNTVAEGSLKIIEVEDGAVVAIYDTINRDDPETPPREHIIQIVPGEKIQEQL